MSSSCATAHPNIALVKYWGKRDHQLNIPDTPSLSLTLDTMTTSTVVEMAESDEFRINGIALKDKKVEDWLRELRTSFDVPPVKIISRNSFPTKSGLASSASGFAALITALNHEFELGLSKHERSSWARRGSASAARSIYGGFVSMKPCSYDTETVQLFPAGHWPLEVVVAITDERAKTVSSSDGMNLSMRTSSFYDAWKGVTVTDYQRCVDAITSRDFVELTKVAQSSCLNMHALMMTSKPPLIYWNSATLECLHRVIELQDDDINVCFTIDAGAQLKAICTAESADRVQSELETLAGVHKTVRCGLGDGAFVGQ